MSGFELISTNGSPVALTSVRSATAPYGTIYVFPTAARSAAVTLPATLTRYYLPAGVRDARISATVDGRLATGSSPGVTGVITGHMVIKCGSRLADDRESSIDRIVLGPSADETVLSSLTGMVINGGTP